LRPVTVGIIGAGNVIWAYFQVLDRLVPRGWARIGPVCARRKETWLELESRRPGLRLVADPAAVVQSDVDVVLVITPPDSHGTMVRLALEHGKHVVVEKPAATTRCEAEQLRRIAQARKLHLMCAPFVQLAPTFRALWRRIQEGAIGKVHSARGLYGNAGSTWAPWYHDGRVSPLAEVGIYNLKSLTAVLGPVVEVQSADNLVVQEREIKGETIRTAGADVSHVLLRHQDGALSSEVSSHCIQRYRRPALEFYGTEGTANLLGDDWDPRGFEIWRNSAACWEEFEAIDSTWLWADGLAEMARALNEDREPTHCLDHDLHLLEIIEASDKAAREKRAIAVESRFCPLDVRLDLRLEERQERHHLHDHTRPADEQ
jgi:predicted dehydrogenase